MKVAVPRDRNGSFEPQVVRKHQTRWKGLDQQTMALYTLEPIMRDIQAQLQKIYGVEVSAGLISEVTDEVLEGVKIWQRRSLENMLEEAAHLPMTEGAAHGDSRNAIHETSNRTIAGRCFRGDPCPTHR